MDNVLADGKPQSSSFTLLFRSKKWIPDFLHNLWRDTGAIILNFNGFFEFLMFYQNKHDNQLFLCDFL